jgi:hypothetical protein
MNKEKKRTDKDEQVKQDRAPDDGSFKPL